MIFPKWKSHKVVEAALIASIGRIETDAHTGSVLILHDMDGPALAVSDAYMEKHQPQIGGYYVRYPDGYESWSPAQAFEEGYTPFHDGDEPSPFGMGRQKTLHNSDVSGARQNVKDIKVVGNGDMFRLLCKASSEAEGWMKSTKAMEVVGGCVVQVTTQQRNMDGSYAVAEALTYVPGVRIADDENSGRKLVPIS